MRCGLAASLVLSALLLVFGRLYTTIYRVEPEVRATAYLLLVVFAVISPVKVQNMILGGRHFKKRRQDQLHPGHRPHWYLGLRCAAGVPGGLCAETARRAGVLLLSLEECVRLALSLRLFKKRIWMQQL